MELAFFYLFMGVGVPSVFYGDEVYIEGMKELEYRAAMDWQAVMEQQIENNRLQGNLAEKFSCWIVLRKEHVALRKGNYRTIYCNDITGAYVFSRSLGMTKSDIFKYRHRQCDTDISGSSTVAERKDNSFFL